MVLSKYSLVNPPPKDLGVGRPPSRVTGQGFWYVCGGWLWLSLLSSHCIPGDVGTLNPIPGFIHSAVKLLVLSIEEDSEAQEMGSWNPHLADLRPGDEQELSHFQSWLLSSYF